MITKKNIAIVFAIFISILIVGVVIKLKSQDSIVPITKLLKQSCAKFHLNEVILNKDCKTVSFDISTTNLNFSNDKLYFLIKVKSINARAAVHILLNEKWNYLYHSGDGEWQYLYSEVPVNNTNLNDIKIIFYGDENNEFKSETVFSEFYIFDDLSVFLEKNKKFKSIWARTNNPNEDYWFDRYSSLVKDFTITLPNKNNIIWERYFGIGINDRNNLGDYFCFPDDVLGIQVNNKMQWFYLGHLKWTRAIQINKEHLEITFKYEGYLTPHERIFQEHSQFQVSFIYDNKDLIASSSSGFFKLEKKYIFSTMQDFAEVQLRAISSDGFSYMWIFQDAAYMDFKIGNNLEVKSWGKDINDSEYFNYKKNDITRKIYQYRIPDKETSIQHQMSSLIESDNADLYFAIHGYLPKYFRSLSLKPSDMINKSHAFEIINKSKNNFPKVFGIGFISNDGKLDRHYTMHFSTDLKIH